MLKRCTLSRAILSLVLLSTAALAQSTATLRGLVKDSAGAVVTNARIIIENAATGISRTVVTDAEGNYSAPSLPPGTYRVTVEVAGMTKAVAENYVLEVSRVQARDFELSVASTSETVNVVAEAPFIESATMTVGFVVDQKTVQEMPLNGRHFIDLASLAPGTLVGPASGGLTNALRGQGSVGIVTAGYRDTSTNFMINGINVNDGSNNQITFQPSINTVSEFKIDNSTYSAEYGRNSGSVVNIATRSGGNAFHGEGFEFVRNMAFDSRNFFNKTYDTAGNFQPVNSFKRNNFGGDIGGPIWKDHTFFFGSYEGLRQRQGLALSSNVPSAAQRSLVTDPTTQKLLARLPAGVQPAAGSPITSMASFVGSASAPVNIDQGTWDISHNFSEGDRLHGYYVFQRDQRLEPNLSGANVPGSGDARHGHRQLLTLNETHVFGASLVNDLRIGFNRLSLAVTPDVQALGLDPSAFGINNGLTGPIGIPQITVTGPGLVFGGERNNPTARGDVTSVFSDSLNYMHGRHSLKFGGEYRRFNGDRVDADEGTLGFPNLQSFLGCTDALLTNCGHPAAPTVFTINSGGNHPSRVTGHALGAFMMDSYKVTPYLTVELGGRWEWNFTPTEALNRSSIFNLQQATLTQIGNGVDEYQQNNKLFQPRLGFAWDLFHNGRTVLRSGYAMMYDQPLPMINSGNPPFGSPIAFTSSSTKPTTGYATLKQDAGGALTFTTADPKYNDAYVQSWNLNLQNQITPSLGMMIGYFGSKGTHLNTQLNVNQLVQTSAGVYSRPIPFLAANSPISPGSGLGNIISNESTGNSHYNALWLTATKHMGHGLQFQSNYTWSKSMDNNSRDLQGIVAQNSLNPAADRGLSDFDARHHLTFSGIYELPFKAHLITSGWRLASTFTLQSGNPLNIVAGNPASGTGIAGFTGTASIRPDLIGALPTPGNTLITTGSNAGNVQWFPGSIVCDPTVGACASNAAFAIPVNKVGGKNVYHFGNLGRNALVGPGYEDVDFSLAKTTRITERISNEFRVEAFDLLNHTNLGNPGLITGASNFGVIKATRSATGDAGSSRQLQLVMKLIF